MHKKGNVKLLFIIIIIIITVDDHSGRAVAGIAGSNPAGCMYVF